MQNSYFPAGKIAWYVLPVCDVRWNRRAIKCFRWFCLFPRIGEEGADWSGEHIRFSESGQAEEPATLTAKRMAPIIRDADGRDSDVREEVRTLLSQEGGAPQSPATGITPS